MNNNRLEEFGFDIYRINTKMDGYNMHRKAIKEALAELGIDERLVNNIGVIETLRQLLHKGAYESLAKEDIQKK